MPRTYRSLLALLTVPVVLTATGLLACASAEIKDPNRYRIPAGFQRPEVVIINDFAGSEQASKEGVANITETNPNLPPEVKEAIARKQAAAVVIGHELAERLRAKGIPIRQAGESLSRGPSIVIDGYFMDVDDGNAFKRVVIGFGAGATEMRTHVDVHTVSGGKRKLIDDFKVIAEGGKAPGVATPLGVGAATGLMAGAVVAATVSVAKETLGPLTPNAEDTAEQISQRVAERFVDEGWLPKEVLD